MNGYSVEALAGHDRSGFESGSAPLDAYFRRQVTQDIRRKVGNCFVAVDGSGVVAGFYTLAATSIPLDKLSEERSKRLPRYPSVPAILVGRLAVATVAQGRGLGGMLLADALTRAGKSDAAGHMLVVNAIDEAAAAFYVHHGFERLPDNRRCLVRLLGDRR
jgi:ribosomal protein S18 acetylase RimI-like enzyme